MKFTRQVLITKFSHDVLIEEKKKHLNSLDKISIGKLVDYAVLKVFCPDKLLILKSVSEYKELIDAYEK